jgi:hypothetical protein
MRWSEVNGVRLGYYAMVSWTQALPYSLAVDPIAEMAIK